MSLTGTLSTMPLPDLLQWLGSARVTGTLRVEREKIGKTFVFQEGKVTGCSSDDPPQKLGHFLVSRGKINEEQLRYSLKLQETTGENLGRILVGMGALSEEDLTLHLAAKAEETIFSIFDWSDASFHFQNGELDVSNLMPVSLGIEEILLRGLKRYDETRMIREVIHGPGMVLATTGRTPPAEVFTNRMARRIYEAIDGQRTVREVVLASHGSEFLVSKLLYELHRGGFVETAHPAHPAPPAEKPAAPATAETGPAGCVAPVVPASRGERPSMTGTAAATDCRSATTADFDAELARARELVATDEYEEALDVLDRLYHARPQNESLRLLAAEAEAAFIDKAYRHLLPANKLPVFADPAESIEERRLSPAEFYLLSRLDGNWDVRSIVQITPMREVDALRTLKRMREQGLIELVDPAA